MPRSIPCAAELRTREYLRGPEVCYILGDIHPATLWKWRKSQGFPAPVRATGSTNWFRTAEVLAWMERHAESHANGDRRR